MPLPLGMHLWLGTHLCVLTFKSLLKHEQINIHGLHQKNIYIHHIKDNMGSTNTDFLITCSIIFFKASKNIK